MSNKVIWQSFPKNKKPTEFFFEIVTIFEKNIDKINSDNKELSSNDVLSAISKDLLEKGYQVELSKKEKIKIPVLYGVSNSVEKSFDVDVYNREKKFVIEVEAGRALSNNQFLKDIFQACVMVDVDYLAIAVRKTYKEKNDFESILKFIETLYSSDKFKIPLLGLVVIGY
jgi:hypothetical protein